MYIIAWHFNNRNMSQTYKLNQDELLNVTSNSPLCLYGEVTKKSKCACLKYIYFNKLLNMVIYSKQG